MNHEIYKINSVSIKGEYLLELEFNDGTKKTINFKSMLKGEMYSPLRDLKLFNQVKLDKEVHTIVWPNGADFDPLILHDWDKYEKEILQRSDKWID